MPSDFKLSGDVSSIANLNYLADVVETKNAHWANGRPMGHLIFRIVGVRRAAAVFLG